MPVESTIGIERVTQWYQIEFFENNSINLNQSIFNISILEVFSIEFEKVENRPSKFTTKQIYTEEKTDSKSTKI